MEQRKKRSYTDELIARSGRHVQQLIAKDSTDQWAFYCVLVQPAKEQLFLRAIESKGVIDLERYGKIIGSCYGKEPTEELRAELREKYGFEV
jgi:hypothetical protein